MVEPFPFEVAQRPILSVNRRKECHQPHSPRFSTTRPSYLSFCHRQGAVRWQAPLPEGFGEAALTLSTGKGYSTVLPLSEKAVGMGL